MVDYPLPLRCGLRAVGWLLRLVRLVCTMKGGWRGGTIRHKQPDRLFLRQDIPLSELIDCWEPLTRQLLGNYPQLNILLTVSPIRHLGDGMHANAVSKAVAPAL